MNIRLALFACVLNLVGTMCLLDADLLDFEGLPLNPGDPIPQDYGDTAEVDVSHRQLDGFGSTGTVIEATLGYWTSGYGNLNNVAYGLTAGASKVGEFRLDAIAGSTVTLDSFDAGDFRPDLTGIQEFKVYDGSWNLIFSQSLDVSDATHDTLTPSVTSSSLIVQWGYPYHIGVDNVAFTVNAAPEPSCAALVIFAIVASWSRWRRIKMPIRPCHRESVLSCGSSDV